MSGDAEAQAPSSRLASWIRRSDVVCGASVFVAVVAVGLVRSPWILGSGRIEDGDFAVNSILIDKAKHFELLVGNYSRVGFNHPGPALMYVQAFGELIFHDLLGLAPRPFNAHVLAILCLCAVMVGLSAGVAVRQTTRPISAGLVLTVALLIGVVEPGSMVSTSFPEIYIWSYLLLVVATAAVFAGAHHELPLVVAAAGLLCHGHVSFFLFVGGFGAAIAIVMWRRRAEALPSRQVVTTSVVVAAVFAFPFALNLVLHWPGELDDYWSYSRGSNAGGHPWIDVAHFVGQFWSADELMGAVLALSLVVTVAALAVAAPPLIGRFATGLIATAVLSTVLLMIYAKRGVDDLSFRYVAEFYITAPVAVVLAGSLIVADRIEQIRFGSIIAWVTIAAASIGLVVRDDMPARYPGANWVIDAERFLDQHLDPETTRVIRFPLEAWPATAGIVEQSRRSGNPVCIDDPGYGFLFDESTVCTDQQRQSGTLVWIRPAGDVSGEASLLYSGDRVVVEIFDGASQ